MKGTEFMSRKPRILVAGSLVMDMTVSMEKFPGRGETVIGCGFHTSPGGKGANQAVGAARLGADVTMLGAVGDDENGRKILDSLENSGVDVSKIIVKSDAPTAVGNVLLEIGETVSNRIIVVPGANMALTSADVDRIAETAGNYDMLLLQLEIPMEVNLAAAKAAKRANIPVMLNPAPYAEFPPELWKNITYITPNEHEAFGFTGEVCNEISAGRTLDVLRNMGASFPIITLGEKGAAYFDDSGKTLLAGAAEYGQVCDPTAAGDSFVAGFCLARCCGADMQSAVLFANHAAAITVSSPGAQPSLPYINQVLDFMSGKELDTSRYALLKV